MLLQPPAFLVRIGSPQVYGAKAGGAASRRRFLTGNSAVAVEYQAEKNADKTLITGIRKGPSAFHQRHHLNKLTS